MEFEINYRQMTRELEDGPASGNILYYAPAEVLLSRVDEVNKQIDTLTKERNRLELRRRLLERIVAKTSN